MTEHEAEMIVAIQDGCMEVVYLEGPGRDLFDERGVTALHKSPDDLFSTHPVGPEDGLWMARGEIKHLAGNDDYEPEDVFSGVEFRVMADDEVRFPRLA